jgi:soluble lytic murein transglycosylase
VLRLVAAVVIASLPVVAAAKPAPAKRPPPSKTTSLRDKLKRPGRDAPPSDADAVQALGRGYRAFLAGDFADAAATLAKIPPRALKNRDYLLYLLGQSELLAGRPTAARPRFAELALMSGRFQTIARWRVADCDYAAGKLDDARRAYEAALGLCNGKCPAEIDAPVARARIAEALEARGAKAAAAEAWRRVALEAPWHPLAAEAPAAIARLGGPPFTAEEHVTRARILTQNRKWDDALHELELVTSAGDANDLPARVRDEAKYWFGTTKFKMRRNYDLAAQALLDVWQRLPGDDRKAEALFHGARAWSRADRDDEAIVNYRLLLDKYPRARQAPEASFLIGWLDFNRGKYATAIPALEDTLRRYGSSQFGDDARWYLGLARWFSGDKKGALVDFEHVARMRGGLWGGKGQYWQGRALVELGRDEEGVAVWKKLAAAYPFGWYAMLARARLKERNIDLPPTVALTGGRVPPFGDPDKELDRDPLIARVDELLQAGLAVEATVELRRGEQDFIRRWGGDRALPVLFDRYNRGEDFHRAHRLAEAWSSQALRVDPHEDAVARKWWVEVYPLAYRSFVEKYGPTGSNPKNYLYTIMQKESAYNPHDVSYADAIGLLQMIPPTSRKVSPHIDLPYTDDILYDPEGNIRFGAWYIGRLLGKFRGQIPIGAGSFNAGPKAMMRWLKANGTRPLDEFVELCPYTQTREYMKKATEIYARYEWLYDKNDYLPSLKVDPTPLDDGIDY